MSSAVKELDRVLDGETRSDDEDVAALAALGAQVRDAYATFTPAHTPERAMFVRAVADKTGYWTWSRVLAPVTVTAAILLALLAAGRSALPGGTFYPVRQVLRTVGLAPASVEEVQKLLAWADRLLDEAEKVSDKDPEAAERHAFEAVRVIGMAEGAYSELEVDERATLTDELARLIARAKAILTEAPAEDADRDADGQAVIKEDDEDGTPGDDDGDGGSGDDSQGDDDDQGQDRDNDDQGSTRGSGGDQDDGAATRGDDDDDNGGSDDGDDDNEADDDTNDDDKDDDKGVGGNNSGPGADDDTKKRHEDGDREGDAEGKLEGDGDEQDEDERVDGLQKPAPSSGRDRPRD